MFTMTTRPFTNRSVAHKWAVKQRPNKADRLVLACEECPPSRRSQRRLPRWSRVAAEVAEAVDADPGTVRRALVAALRHEKSERRDPFGEVRPGGGEAFGSDNPALPEPAPSVRAAVAAQGES